MKKILLLAVLGLTVLLSGCASKHMQKVDPASVPSAPMAENESAIVFIRSTNFGGAILAPVVESVDGTLKLIGIVSAGAKVRHSTTIGKHFYIVGGESSNMLEADLEGGKTYYAYVDPQFGFAKARFEFIPVTQTEATSEEFKKDFDWCSWETTKPEAESWLNENMESMRNKHENAKSKEKRAIIYPQYGIIQPLK